MKTILLTLTLLFSVNAVYAADAGGWYENLLKGLRTRVQKKMEARTRVSAVAAVRGAKQGSDPRALYWKGGVSDAAQKKLDVERKQLADAVQLAVDGSDKAAKAALEKFLRENQESVYLPEAKEALEKLQPEKPAGTEAAKPAAAETERPAAPGTSKPDEAKTPETVTP